MIIIDLKKSWIVDDDDDVFCEVFESLKVLFVDELFLDVLEYFFDKYD